MSFIKFKDNIAIIDPILKNINTNLNIKDIYVSPDKSITHRLLIFAAMAKGESIIYNPSTCLDCINTLKIIQKLGINFKIYKTTINKKIINVLKLKSPGINNLKLKTKILYFNNSGTGARILIPLLSTIPKIKCVCTGDKSLSNRPMDRVAMPLIQVGAQISLTRSQYLPITIKGKNINKGIKYKYNLPSAQVKSAIIISALNINAKSCISLPSGGRDHTEYILKNKLNAPIHITKNKNYEHIEIQGKWQPPTFEAFIPHDISSAAYLFAIIAIIKKGCITITNVSKNLTRLGFITALIQMGVKVEFIAPSLGVQNWFEHDVCDIQLRADKQLKPIKISSQHIPTLIDEIPILAIVCGFAPGISVIQGISDLKFKESNRIKKTLELLNIAGIMAWYHNNSLYIKGTPNPKIRSFCFNPDNDHRIAMCASILALFAEDTCSIQKFKCVYTSWPNFYNCLINIFK